MCFLLLCKYALIRHIPHNYLFIISPEIYCTNSHQQGIVLSCELNASLCTLIIYSQTQDGVLIWQRKFSLSLVVPLKSGDLSGFVSLNLIRPQITCQGLCLHNFNDCTLVLKFQDDRMTVSLCIWLLQKKGPAGLAVWTCSESLLGSAWHKGGQRLG